MRLPAWNTLLTSPLATQVWSGASLTAAAAPGTAPTNPPARRATPTRTAPRRCGRKRRCNWSTVTPGRASAGPGGRLASGGGRAGGPAGFRGRGGGGGRAAVRGGGAAGEAWVSGGVGGVWVVPRDPATGVMAAPAPPAASPAGSVTTSAPAGEGAGAEVVVEAGLVDDVVDDGRVVPVGRPEPPAGVEDGWVVLV